MYDFFSKGGVTLDESITETEYSKRITNVNIITMGLFSATVTQIKESVLIMGVLDMEHFEGLEVSISNDVLRSMSVVYLNYINRIMKIETYCNCFDQKFDRFPVCNPVYLMKLLII